MRLIYGLAVNMTFSTHYAVLSNVPFLLGWGTFYRCQDYLLYKFFPVDCYIIRNIKLIINSCISHVLAGFLKLNNLNGIDCVLLCGIEKNFDLWLYCFLYFVTRNTIYYLKFIFATTPESNLYCLTRKSWPASFCVKLKWKVIGCSIS